MMALHDVCHRMNINIDSDEAVEFNDHLFEFYSYMLFLQAQILQKKKVHMKHSRIIMESKHFAN
jgi:ribonucleotide reductase alpha subunit